MNVSNLLKEIVNRVAGRYGYRVERIVDYGEHALNLFEILVNQLGPTRDNFFVVQVGANDGKADDPVHDLVDRFGWRGLLLEPLPHVFARLSRNYHRHPQLILENAAVAPQDGTRSLWTVKGADVLASFDRQGLAARLGDPSNMVEVPVQTVSLTTLVHRHAIDHIDLLVIDTEGFDYEVCKLAMAKGIPRPRLIRYEHLHLSPADRHACATLLASNGYRLIRDGIDTLALHHTVGA